MAVTTITTTAPQDARIVVAFGDYLGFPVGVSANAAQVKQAVIDFMVAVVLNYERKVASASAAAAITPVTPT